MSKRRSNSSMLAPSEIQHEFDIASKFSRCLENLSGEGKTFTESVCDVIDAKNVQQHHIVLTTLPPPIVTENSINGDLYDTSVLNYWQVRSTEAVAAGELIQVTHLDFSDTDFDELSPNDKAVLEKRLGREYIFTCPANFVILQPRSEAIVRKKLSAVQPEATQASTPALKKHKGANERASPNECESPPSTCRSNFLLCPTLFPTAIHSFSLSPSRSLIFSCTYITTQPYEQHPLSHLLQV
jgi:hypothetical protein